MNRLLILVFALLVVAGIGWLNRIDLLLMVVKYQADREFDVGPTRELRWQKGWRWLTPAASIYN